MLMMMLLLMIISSHHITVESTRDIASGCIHRKHLGASPTAMAEVNAPVLDVAFRLRGKLHHLVDQELNIFFVLAWNILGLLLRLLLGHQGSAGETIQLFS